jgi:hypothetical protein
MVECMASDRILTEPVNIPTINFMIIKLLLEIMESEAVFTLSSILNIS